MFAQPTDSLRQELLALNGVGPETADSILLYAGQHPVFVVDAYTRQILARHRLFREKVGYEEICDLFERSLRPVVGQESLETGNSKPETRLLRACHHPSPMSLARRTPLVQVYNDMHALIVGVGKNYCLKSQHRCDLCPLQTFLPRGGAV